MDVATRAWSARELEERLEREAVRTAVVDCDGTLWSGDSGYGFMVWSMEQGLLSREASDWLDERHRAYEAGAVSEEEICGEMVQVYAGLREAEVRSAAATFVRQSVSGRHFEEMERIVARLQARGATLWAVSSTNRWVVEAGVAAFGVGAERVLAAAVTVTDGLLTAELIDVPTDGGKARALRRVGVAEPDVVFGNSLHDLAMMEMARLAVPVNASAGLRMAAAERGWRVLTPRAGDGSEEIVGQE